MTVLDLLSAVGSLPTSGDGSFKDAVQAITGQDTVFAYRRFLEGLGHARTERGDGKIHVLSPRLVSLPREEDALCVVLLSGARSEEMVTELNYLASSYCITIESSELGSSLPPRITMRGTAEALKGIAAKCNSLPLDIAEDPSTPDAWRLLSSVPPLGSIIQGFTRERIGTAREEPSPSAEVFNPASGYYSRWSSLRESYPSSYILWRKSAYDFRLTWRLTPEGELGVGTWVQRLAPLELDPLWARWAVAYSANPRSALPAISEQGAYKVRRITPLPIELHRVCCLCSGFPPEDRDGFNIYRSVPPIIQHRVNDLLKVDNP